MHSDFRVVPRHDLVLKTQKDSQLIENVASNDCIPSLCFFSVGWLLAWLEEVVGTFVVALVVVVVVIAVIVVRDS